MFGGPDPSPASSSSKDAMLSAVTRDGVERQSEKSTSRQLALQQWQDRNAGWFRACPETLELHSRRLGGVPPSESTSAASSARRSSATLRIQPISAPIQEVTRCLEGLSAIFLLLLFLALLPARLSIYCGHLQCCIHDLEDYVGGSLGPAQSPSPRCLCPVLACGAAM